MVVLNSLKITEFFGNANYINKHNVIFIKTVTKPDYIFCQNVFFPNLNPISYLNLLIASVAQM